MFAKMTSTLDFQAKALMLRSERQRAIASNIANADTPGYIGRDLNFKEAMSQALGDSSGLPLAPASSYGMASDGTTHPGHIPLRNTNESEATGENRLAYTLQSQPSMDGNSVDLDRERASFVDNAVHYEATLRFINNTSKTMLSAIQGQ